MFKESKIVKRLLENNQKNPQKLYDEENSRKLSDPDEKIMNEAFNQICEMWNKDEKTRGFIKYLIRSFSPRQPMNKILSFSAEAKEGNLNRCCITHKRLAGIDEIADAWSKVGLEKMAADMQAYTEGRDRLQKKVYAKLKAAERAMPVEVRNATIGYYSDDEKCTKYLSGEAWCALMIFISQCLLNDEKEVNYIIRKKMLEAQREAGLLEPKEEKPKLPKPKKAAAKIEDEIDPAVAAKLLALKKSLKS